jgi:diketogulonate reductase-like aldo/keto reductase
MSTSTSERVPSVPLRGGASIPQLGFGTFQVPPEQTTETVLRAFEAGYRHIDTAAGYRNEAEVGAAVHASGLARADVFITTKLLNDNHGHEEAKRAFHESLHRLETDYIDLYLIHWPVPATDRYAETWRAFTELAAEGHVRAIGVSNFNQPHLERVISETGVVPALNQIELHPYLQQPGLRHELAELEVVTESWSPLAQGAVLDDPVIVEIAARHGKSTAQVVIRWHLQLGNVVIPKSMTPQRIEENIDVFDFRLSGEEMEAIEGLDRGERTGPDPALFIRP